MPTLPTKQAAQTRYAAPTLPATDPAFSKH